MATSSASNRREQLRRQQEADARARRTNRFIGFGAAAVALVLIGVFAFVLVSNMNASNTPQVTPPIANAEGDALVINPTPAPESAPVVTLYLDYQCPNCRVFEDSYGAMLEEEANAGTWTLEYKTMTFMDQNIGNTASTRAAIAAACSALSGHYPDYNREIYANQAVAEVRGAEGYSDELLRATIPATVGMTGEELTRFQTCYDGRATEDFVRAVDQGAYEDGVAGTPSLAVNGEVLDLRQVADPSPEGLKAHILANA